MLTHDRACLRLPSGRFLCVHGCLADRATCMPCGGLGTLIERWPNGIRVEHTCAGCLGHGHVSRLTGPISTGWRRMFILPDGRHLAEQAAKQEGLIS